MKKQLLTIFAAITVSSALAQVASPSWSISQYAAFTTTAAGIRFMDAVDQNVMWVTGYDGMAPSRNYNWYSRTINGGTSYNAGNILPDTNTWVLANLDAVDANTAWVSMYAKAAQAQGTVFRTTNGGATWSNMNNGSMFTNAASFANVVCFLTPSLGIAMGDPIAGEFELWRTTNGGASWTQVPGASIPNPTAGEFGIVNVYCKQGTSNMWFGTNFGRMFYTNNGGLTWNVAVVGTVNSFIIDVAFTDPLNGVAYANNGGVLEMYNTVNGGATWTAITPVPANVGVNDICAVPNSNGFVSAGAGTGNQLISFSTNNGTTWTDYGSTGIQYLTVDFADNTTGWSGSFSDIPVAFAGGIWKYSGAAFGGIVPPTANFTLPFDLCLVGNTATAVPTNSSTGSPALTYAWSATPVGATFSNPNVANPTITFAGGGTYSVVCVVTNGVGSNTSSQQVLVQTCSAPLPAFTTTANPCNNVVFTATNTSTGAPTPIYTWSITPSAGVTLTPGPNATNPSFKASTPGTYTLTLLASNASGTAQVTQTVNVANCNPVVGFNIPSTTCATISPITTSNTTTSSNSFTWTNVPNTGVFQINAPGGNKTYTFTIPGTYSITLKASNPSGTAQITHTILVTDCGPVSIFEKADLISSTLVYPNPAHELIHVVLPNNSEAYTITLVNVLGSLVYEEAIAINSKETVSINLANKPKGIYFLSVESKSEKFTKKIIVE